MKILICGATGLLGSYLSNFFLKMKYSVIRAGFKKKGDVKINLCDFEDTKKKIKKIKPNVIINCAAYTNVDDCDKNIFAAINGNVITIKNILLAIKKIKLKSHLIHISTDQVYNNLNSTKKNKEKNVNFINNYAISKYMGEKQILNYNKSLIIRTNFFGQSILKNRLSYSDWVIKNLKLKKKIKVASNIFFNPIHMKFLCTIIELSIKKKIFGIYNIGSKDCLSKYKFCFLIAKKFKLNYKKYLKKIKIVTNVHYKPTGTIMDINKIEKKLFIKLPYIKKSIDLL
jgi:dTDP-4-dehydrorhamnose reductase